MRTIDSTSLLPKEFAIEKYERCDDFNIDDWCWHLFARHDAYRGYERLPQKKEKQIMKNLSEPINHASIGSTPEIFFYGLRADEPHFMFSKDEPPIEGYTDGICVATKHIRPLSAAHIKHKMHQHPDKSPSGYPLPFDGFDHQKRIRAHLTVSLDTDTDVLAQEFVDVINKLKKLRNTPAPTKKQTENNVKKLSMYRVLPYLDLYIWSQSKSITISPNVYAVALFPRGEYGERHVRENVHQLAMAAVDPTFINNLSHKLGSGYMA